MEQNPDAPLVLRLAGPVQLSAPGGGDLTPPAAKLRALLVLIATGPKMTRPRAFLQDMLWSCASPKKGAASLRQALSTLRRVLGPDNLMANQSQVSLNPKRVTIDLSLDPTLDETPEFAAGLDVPDPEFENWLRDRRSEFERITRTIPAQRSANVPVLMALPPVCSDDGMRATADVIAADITSHVANCGDAVVQMGNRAPHGSNQIAVQMRAARAGSLMRYQAQLIDVAQRRAIWTGGCDCKSDDPEVISTQFSDLTSRAGFAAIQHFGRQNPHEGLSPDRIAYQLFAQFPFDYSEKTRKLDHLLQEIPDQDATGLSLAWRARLRVIAMIERRIDPDAAREEAEALSREAMARDPSNPMVLALAGEVALQLQARPELAGELAQSGIARDALNPFCAEIHAQALVRAGRAREGLAETQRALRLAAGMPNRSWFHTGCAAAAIRVGEFDLARKHAEIAHAQSPTFHPPLRFLTGLRFAAGDEPGTADALSRLRDLEPDFSLARLADPSYPVASMRGTPLMNVTTSELLAA